LGQLPAAQRPAVGQRANAVKARLEQAFDAADARLKQAAFQTALSAERVDVTLPGRPVALGRLHVTTQTLREIYHIFGQMGFQVFESPEVELDEFNFTLLNIPPYHPARDMQDTFYTTNPDVLLRTHTSPGQIRAMRQYHPEPIRIILPGKTYRYENITASKDIQFGQVEGLAVGRTITMGDLKGVFVEFTRQFFGPERRLRFRASYFPFTEPSAEIDMDCVLCDGAGCRLCKHTGWLEISGAGMVHPDVLRHGGYDPDEYTGFAFGMGVERPAILKYGIDGIRHFLVSDLRFLEQF
jgi:phenylalanyl-tRNA synthetase alpha chain